MRYKQRTDGEGFEIPIGEVYRLACCDCGLVHDVVFVFEDGKLGMAAKRNNRATAQRRRHIGVKDLEAENTALREALQTLMNYEGIIYNHGGVGAIMKANKVLAGRG